MAWSIFQLPNGDGEAATWADDALSQIGAPQSPGNEKFMYDWETSEGGGGKFNPLNQGPVPGHPGLTSTGQQYGGGAADYRSWKDGLTGFADYMGMTDYAKVKADLMNDDQARAKQDLWASPWAGSHYGYGSAWSDVAFPGKKAPLDPSGGKVGNLKVTTTSSILPSWITDILGIIPGLNFLGNGSLDIADWLERGALMLFGGILMIVGIIVLFKGPERAKKAASGGNVSQSDDDEEPSPSQKPVPKVENRASSKTQYEGTHRKQKISERPARGKHAAADEKTPGRHAAKSSTGPAGESAAVDNMIIPA